MGLLGSSRVVGALAALLMAASGCSSQQESGAEVDRSTQDNDLSGKRIVALGEEFLLADLLDFGVTPLASTSNYPDAFPGIDPDLTEGIELLSTFALDIEQILALEPDLVMVSSSLLDYTGTGVIDNLPNVEVIDSSTWQSQYAAVGALAGMEDVAGDRIADVERAMESAAVDMADLGPISLATAYPGGWTAAWTSQSPGIPALVDELGIEIVPEHSGVADPSGRITLSEERLADLDGETLILLQSDLIDGEPEALSAATQDPLWQAIPAVRNDRVITMDRLGYPGLAGRERALADLITGIEELQ